jgi:hypothetical protein
MSCLGVELEGSVLRWVEVHGTPDAHVVGGTGRIKLTATRDRAALQAFGNAVKALLEEIGPTVIGIKEKPEGKGRMTAGPASSKMEGLFLYHAPVDPVFISGAKINKCPATDPKIKGGAPEEPAFKAAICALSAG